ncbi:MAG: hypothetical protein ACHRXM_33810 [Isosphaerales bacterium]
MYIDLILWDDEDDPQGNVHHITGPGEVTTGEVEDVLYDQNSRVELSKRSGDPIAFGWTSTGKHIAVVFTFEDDPVLTIVKPKTAYPVPEYGG